MASSDEDRRRRAELAKELGYFPATLDPEDIERHRRLNAALDPHPPESGWRAMAVRLRREASRWDSGYPADGVDHTLSTLIFNRVLNAARYSSPIPMLTA